MAIDIELLTQAYFTFDLPVPYKLHNGTILNISPIKLSDSIIFLTSYGILDIDKNQSSNVEDIQMSYLQYMEKRLLTTPQTKQQLANICILCLGFTCPHIKHNDKGKPILIDLNEDGSINYAINAKEFDDIRRIILYQNVPKYDDKYIDPELKANMREMDSIKSKDVMPPTLERKFGIITAHCGISKQEQMNMTMRSFNMLFDEVCGEVEYMVTKPVAMYAGKSDECRWIYPKKKGKYDDYITSVDEYNKSMGGNGVVKSSTTKTSESLDSQYNQFIGG